MRQLEIDCNLMSIMKESKIVTMRYVSHRKDGCYEILLQTLVFCKFDFYSNTSCDVDFKLEHI